MIETPLERNILRLIHKNKTSVTDPPEDVWELAKLANHGQYLPLTAAARKRVSLWANVSLDSLKNNFHLFWNFD